MELFASLMTAYSDTPHKVSFEISMMPDAESRIRKNFKRRIEAIIVGLTHESDCSHGFTLDAHITSASLGKPIYYTTRSSNPKHPRSGVIVIL
jgi:hypothetical protein